MPTAELYRQGFSHPESLFPVEWNNMAFHCGPLNSPSCGLDVVREIKLLDGSGKQDFNFITLWCFHFLMTVSEKNKNKTTRNPSKQREKKKKKHIQCIAFNQTSAVESGFVCLFHFLLPYSTHGAILLVGRINSQPPNKPTTGPPGAVVIYFHN